jgi:hypothetical protein
LSGIGRFCPQIQSLGLSRSQPSFILLLLKSLGICLAHIHSRANIMDIAARHLGGKLCRVIFTGRSAASCEMLRELFCRVVCAQCCGQMPAKLDLEQTRRARSTKRSSASRVGARSDSETLLANSESPQSAVLERFCEQISQEVQSAWLSKRCRSAAIAARNDLDAILRRGEIDKQMNLLEVMLGTVTFTYISKNCQQLI